MMLNLISSLVAVVSGLLDKFIEDKDQRALLAHEIATLAEKKFLRTSHSLAETSIDTAIRFKL